MLGAQTDDREAPCSQRSDFRGEVDRECVDGEPGLTAKQVIARRVLLLPRGRSLSAAVPLGLLGCLLRTLKKLGPRGSPCCHRSTTDRNRKWRGLCALGRGPGQELSDQGVWQRQCVVCAAAQRGGPEGAWSQNPGNGSQVAGRELKHWAREEGAKESEDK